MGDGWRWIACLSLCLSLPPSLIISLSLSLTFLHMAFPFPFTACTARQTFTNIPSSDHSRCCCSHSRLWPVPQCRRYSLSKSPNRSFDFGSCISTFDTRESICTRAYVQEHKYKKGQRRESTHQREYHKEGDTREKVSVHHQNIQHLTIYVPTHTRVFPISYSLVSRLSSLVSRLSSIPARTLNAQ